MIYNIIGISRQELMGLVLSFLFRSAIRRHRLYLVQAKIKKELASVLRELLRFASNSLGSMRILTVDGR
jgi:hypothetical protein